MRFCRQPAAEASVRVSACKGYGKYLDEKARKVTDITLTDLERI
jgi:hypothetical protein